MKDDYDPLEPQAEIIPEEMIIKSIINNDTGLFVEIAESFHLEKDKEIECLDLETIRVILLILSTAAAKVSLGELDEWFAETLIEYIAREVDILAFIKAMVLTKKLDESGLEFLDVPNDVLIGVIDNKWEKEFKKKVSSLGKITFEELVIFIAERVSSLSSDWSLPLISYAYREKILPRTAILSLMAGNLRQPLCK